MIQVWVDGQGFKKTVDGFKDLRKGDRFRITGNDGKGGSIMIAKGNPYRTVKDDRMVWIIKADFDLEVDT